MGLFDRLFGNKKNQKLIDSLSFEGKSAAETWSTRRDAAAELGSLGNREAIQPLRTGMKAAVSKMRSLHAEMSRTEIDCLMSWRLTPLVSHTDVEWKSLSERTGTSMTIIRIGEFEWAWATALIHAEAIAKLGEKSAPSELLSELQQLEGSQWKNVESLLREAGVL